MDKKKRLSLTKMFNKYINTPLSCFILQAVAIYVIFFCIYKQEPDHYKRDLKEQIIYSKISSIVQQCGNFSFITWFTLHPESKQYLFKEVIGCNKERGKDCAFSAKEQNPFYLVPHDLDDKTIKFDESIKDGEIAYYEDASKLKEYPAINEILKNSNFKITTSTNSIIRDSKDKMTYSLAFSYVDVSERLCNRNQISTLMRELSKLIKDNLSNG